MKRGQGGGDGGKEPVIEIHTTQKTLKLHLGIRARHGPDSSDLGLQWADAPGADCVAEKSDGSGGKDALCPVDSETSSIQAVKKLADMDQVRGQVGARHKDVVQVDEDERQTAQYTVH